MSRFDVVRFRTAEEQMIGMTQILFPYDGLGLLLPIKSTLQLAVAYQWAILLPEPISFLLQCVLKQSKRNRDVCEKRNGVVTQQSDCHALFVE